MARNRCIGIVVATQGNSPIRRCVATAQPGFPLCEKCNKRPIRQAALAVALRSDWEENMQRAVKGEEPNVILREAAAKAAVELPPVPEAPQQTQADRFLDTLEWWKSP